jgi:hypothetical protein
MENENIGKMRIPEGGLAINEAEEWEDVDMSSLREIGKANETYRTPGKIKIGKFIAKTSDSVVEGTQVDLTSFIKVEKLNIDVSLESTVSEATVNRGIVNMLQQWDVLAENMNLLHRELGGEHAKDWEFKEELIDTFTTIEVKINEMDSRMKIIISKIGSDEIASEKGSNSI